MAKLNMVNMNTLFKKGYPLAGVIMAANMFIINEVKAMNFELDTYNGMKKYNNIPNINPGKGEIKEEEKKENNNNKKIFFTQDCTKKTTREILFLENYFNFFGTLALSGVNNYFKWWNYDQGRYCKIGCFGWRSRRFLKDSLQFDVNLNLGRGILWLIPGILFFSKFYDCYLFLKKPIPLEIVKVFIIKEEDDYRMKNKKEKYISLALFILQGFISMPLTVHISKLNFSISISLDAIIWQIIWMICSYKFNNRLNSWLQPGEKSNINSQQIEEK